MKLRVGVIGLGDAWENRHKRALRSLADRFDVRAFCDGVAARAEQAAREFGALSVDGFRTLVHREDIDAILLLGPEWYGHLPILAACDVGKAIYCAPALDIDPAKAREIKQRVSESGVAFMAELPRRHSPATLRLKELIATRLGAPRLMFCHARRKAEKSDRQRGHFCPESMRDLMELVDWCRYVAGNDPTSVIGISHLNPTLPGGSDYQMMSLDFSAASGGASQPGNGLLAHISCGRYMPANWPEAIQFRPPAELQVCCEKGVAFIDLPATLVWFDEAGRHMESLESERPVGEQMLTQFYRGVTSLVRKTSDLEDAYRALTIVLTARESFAAQRRLELTF